MQSCCLSAAKKNSFFALYIIFSLVTALFSSQAWAQKEVEKPSQMIHKENNSTPKRKSMLISPAQGLNAFYFISLPAWVGAPHVVEAAFAPKKHFAQPLQAAWLRKNKAFQGISSSQTAALATCTAFAVPFFESFEEDSPSITCWTTIDVNNDNNTWELNNNYEPYEGEASAMLDNFDYESNDWLISPTINLSSTPVTKRLKFYYRVDFESSDDHFEVLLSTNGAAPANFTHTLVPLTTYHNEEYIEKIVLLQDESGVAFTGNVNIAFYAPAGIEDGGGIYIDNFIVENVPACQDITELKACAGSDDATITWTPNGQETSWEYVLSPPNSTIPTTNGTLVNTPQVTIENLNVNETYNVWVRSVCPNNQGYSTWKKVVFLTASSNLKNMNPFCAGPEGIVFPNVHDEMEVPDAVEGSFHCLDSTPNPVWYYLKIQNNGQIDFQIEQNTTFDAAGNPTGEALDVDFVAFGPFNSVDDFCGGITIAQGSPAGNPLIACSYSADPIENFTIPNAQTGQIYAILITNYQGSEGFIKLVQTNAEGAGAGSTDCSFLCEVDLGEDQTVCEGTPVTLTATTTSAGGDAELISVEWFKDNVPMNPAQFNTPTITVNESGTYKVKISKENCEDEFIYDEVVVEILPAFSGEVPKNITLCDALNDHKETFALAEFITQLNLPHGYKAKFFATEQQAQTGDPVDALPGSFTSGVTTIYLRVSSTVLEECYALFPVQLKLTPFIYPVVDFSYASPICYDAFEEVHPNTVAEFTTGGVFSAPAGLSIQPNTGVINVKQSKPGTYTVTYNYVVPQGNCGEDKRAETTVVITEPIQFEFYSFCSGNQLYVQAVNKNNNVPIGNYTFIWDNVASAEQSTAKVNTTGEIRVTITDVSGCTRTLNYNVESSSCLIAKGISPNNDGLNDVFDLSNYDVKQLSIFNRYGKEVYSHKEGYKKEWNGQDKGGKLLPDGTYFYRILTPTEELTGYIQVVREIK